jgi:hypothetical protein
VSLLLDRGADIEAKGEVGLLLACFLVRINGLFSVEGITSSVTNTRRLSVVAS